MPAADRQWLLVGGTGRVGQLMQPHWQACLPAGVELVLQHRQKDRSDGLFWLPMQEPLPIACRPKAMIVLSGVTPGRGDLDDNRRIAETVLQAAADAGVERVLLASSQAVYGAGQGLAMAEDAPTQPVNAYGAAKLAMEQAVDRFRTAGMDLCCLRIGNVAGADAMLVNAAQATDQAPVVIDQFDTGESPIRSYIGAGTLARVLTALLTAPGRLPPVLNIAAPGPVAMADLVRAAGRPFVYRPAPPTAFARILIDCSRLNALFAFSSADSDPAAMVAQCHEALVK
jgi:UDP-glucose 4-epimerase